MNLCATLLHGILETPITATFTNWTLVERVWAMGRYHPKLQSLCQNNRATFSEAKAVARRAIQRRYYYVCKQSPPPKRTENPLAGKGSAPHIQLKQILDWPGGSAKFAEISESIRDFFCFNATPADLDTNRAYEGTSPRNSFFLLSILRPFTPRHCPCQ